MSTIRADNISPVGSTLTLTAPVAGLSVASGLTVGGIAFFSGGVTFNSTSTFTGLVTLTGGATSSAVISCATAPTQGQHLANKTYVDGFVGRGTYTVYSLASPVYGTAPTVSAAGSYSPAVTTTTTRGSAVTYTSPANSSVHVHTMVNRNSGITVNVGGINILYFSASNVGEYVNFIVPPNTTYSITAASGIGYWAEFIS